jgi:hypothetical protein
VRNDSVIDYSAYPHEAEDAYLHDLTALLEFIRFIFRQECDEYKYMAKRGPADIKLYESMLGDVPICWRLLRSVIQRSNSLLSASNLTDRGRVKEARDLFVALREDIQRACNQSRILPKVPPNKRYLVFDFGGVPR